MNNKIIIINGPNLNLLGEREQSEYGSTTFEELKKILPESGSYSLGIKSSKVVLPLLSNPNIIILAFLFVLAISFVIYSSY